MVKKLYPTARVITKVTAGSKFDIALAMEDEARYNPSKYTFWLRVTLLSIISIKTLYKLHIIVLFHPKCT